MPPSHPYQFQGAVPQKIPGRKIMSSPSQTAKSLVKLLAVVLPPTGRDPVSLVQGLPMILWKSLWTPWNNVLNSQNTGL